MADVVWDQGGHTSDPVEPVLQLQDGSFAGTVPSGSEDILLVFDTAGDIKWTLPGHNPVMATTGGGLVAATATSAYAFEASGAATEQISRVPAYSWDNRLYSLTTGGIAQISFPTVEWAASYAAMYGGNPSANGTFVGVAPPVQGFPVFALPYRGGFCSTSLQPNNDPPIPLGGPALTKYQLLKQEITSAGYLTVTPSTCSNFFQLDPVRVLYFDQLQDAVTRQTPYDGSLTTISLYDAGMLSPTVAAVSPVSVSSYKTAPVCSLFLTQSRAAAQLTAPNGPATDVYITTRPDILPLVSQATILHEALHNLTGLHDFLDLDQRIGTPPPFDLKTFMGLELKPGINPRPRDTTDISEKLKEVMCVAN